MCYIKSIIPTQYDTSYLEYLTYTEEEAALYPHWRKRMMLAPAGGRWENIVLPWTCCSSDKDSMLVCYIPMPAEYEWIYKPKDKALGKPFYKVLRFLQPRQSELKSGYLSVPRDLLCFQPLYLQYGEDAYSLTKMDELELTSVLLPILAEYPGVQMELNYYEEQEESCVGDLAKARMDNLLSFLLAKGVHPHGLLINTHFKEKTPFPSCVAEYQAVTKTMFRLVWQ